MVTIYLTSYRFLLKYASRDAVEIFNFGSGGLSEARAALLDYDEKSPLYGFLLFRRRKVLLKYVPQGTSRLLQGAPNFPAPIDRPFEPCRN